MPDTPITICAAPSGTKRAADITTSAATTSRVSCLLSTAPREIPIANPMAPSVKQIAPAARMGMNHGEESP